jgi:hypothetical protein
MSYETFYAVPKNLYQDFVSHKDEGIRSGATSITIRQLNNIHDSRAAIQANDQLGASRLKIPSSPVDRVTIPTTVTPPTLSASTQNVTPPIPAQPVSQSVSQPPHAAAPPPSIPTPSSSQAPIPVTQVGSVPPSKTPTVQTTSNIRSEGNLTIPNIGQIQTGADTNLGQSAAAATNLGQSSNVASNIGQVLGLGGSILKPQTRKRLSFASAVPNVDKINVIHSSNVVNEESQSQNATSQVGSHPLTPTHTMTEVTEVNEPPIIPTVQELAAVTAVDTNPFPPVEPLMEDVNIINPEIQPSSLLPSHHLLGQGSIGKIRSRRSRVPWYKQMVEKRNEKNAASEMVSADNEFTMSPTVQEIVLPPDLAMEKQVKEGSGKWVSSVARVKMMGKKKQLFKSKALKTLSSSQRKRRQLAQNLLLKYRGKKSLTESELAQFNKEVNDQFLSRDALSIPTEEEIWEKEIWEMDPQEAEKLERVDKNKNNNMLDMMSKMKSSSKWVAKPQQEREKLKKVDKYKTNKMFDMLSKMKSSSKWNKKSESLEPIVVKPRKRIGKFPTKRFSKRGNPYINKSADDESSKNDEKFGDKRADDSDLFQEPNKKIFTKIAPIKKRGRKDTLPDDDVVMKNIKVLKRSADLRPLGLSTAKRQNANKDVNPTVWVPSRLRFRLRKRKTTSEAKQPREKKRKLF